jgi:hypothetical protein
VFANSLGVNTGPTAEVESGFDARWRRTCAPVSGTRRSIRDTGDGGIGSR